MTTPAAQDRDALALLWAELRALVAPLQLAAGSPAQRTALAARLGWDLAALGDSLAVGDLARIDASIDEWIAAVDAAITAVEQALADGVPDSLGELVDRGKIAANGVKALRGLPQLWKAQAPDPAMLARMGDDLLDHLTDVYLASRSPALRHLLAVLGVFVPAEYGGYGVPEPVTGAPVRLPVRRPDLRPEVIGALLRDPVAALRGVYGSDADEVADRLFPRLAALFGSLGLDAWYGVRAGTDLGAWTPELAGRMLTVRGEVGRGAARSQWGLSVALSTADRGGLGLVVVPHGAVALAAGLGAWNLSATLSGDGAAFAVSPDGLVVDGGAAAVELDLSAIRRRVADTPAFRLGAADGTRIELDEFAIRAFAALAVSGDHDYGIGIEAGAAALIIRPGADADSFLNKIIPRDGVRIPLAAALAWSRRGGLSFGGGAALDTTVPLNLALGPVRVDALRLSLAAAAGDRGLRATAAADVRFALGPVIGVVDEIGVRADLTFPPEGGNAGPADLALGFAFPKGIALRVDGGAVTGAGFLAFDPELGRYGGGVDLEFARLRLSALGLLTTRLPGGRPGFSLLVIVNARFPQPIPLGFGFNLAGVGGLLGINRAVDVERMRSGLRSGSLTALLAPGDLIGRETNLLADLEGLFPATPGRFVFGPTARITWGVPTVITADLGLALELPNPVRLLAAGRLRVLLPDERAPVAVINMDALGVLDFGAGTLSVDAVLYDSQIAGWRLTGEMALRARWTGGGEFALSIGGFHPRFKPPAAFPSLERLAMAIGSGKLRARLAGYLALTSNTLQLGAMVEVYAEAASFTAEGMFRFDAIVQFSPFGFEIDLALKIAVRWNGKLLLGITADLYVRGPGRWHIRGHASIKMLFLTATVRFEGRFGREQAVLPVPAQDVAALVRAALASPGSWQIEERPGALPAVTLRPVTPAAGGMLVSPSALITARQRVAPVGGTHLDRFGEAPVDGDAELTIDSAQLGGVPADVSDVRDPFAPAQFFALSDEEKLARASFDLMPSGVSFTATAAVVHDEAGPAPVAIGYRTVVIDEPDAPARPLAAPAMVAANGASGGDWVLDGADLDLLAPGGAAGRAATRGSGTARFETADAGLALSVADEGFLVVSAARLIPAGPQPERGVRWSRSEAAEALRRFAREHPPVPGQELIVLPAAEAVQAVQAVETVELEGVAR